MKKFLVGTLMLFVFAVLLPMAASAQKYCRYNVRNDRQGYNYVNYGNNSRRNRSVQNRRGNGRQYNAPSYYSQRRPSFYRRHRNLVNVGIGTGGGAVVGGLLGGKRGAAWGALAGAGASAVYTYKIRPKQRRYQGI